MCSYRHVLLVKCGIAAMIFAVGFAQPPKAEAAHPALKVAEWVGTKLFGWGLDKLWDAITGKPNVSAIDQRLKELEDEVGRRDQGMANDIRWLRQQMTGNTTLPEYLRLAKQASDNVAKRVEILEERGEVLTRDVQDLKSRFASQSRDFENRLKGLEVRTDKNERKIAELRRRTERENEQDHLERLRKLQRD